MAPSLQRLERFGPLEATSISSVPSSTTCVWQQLECLNSAAAASGSWMNLHLALSWHLRSVLGVAQHILFVFPSRGDERSAERVGLIRGRKSSDSHDGMVLFEF